MSTNVNKCKNAYFKKKKIKIKIKKQREIV